MTNSEVLKIAKGRCANCKDSHLCDICDVPVIIKALGKQIPQKVNDGDCPVCGSFISKSDAGYEVPYCKDCGQALLWGEIIDL